MDFVVDLLLFVVLEVGSLVGFVDLVIGIGILDRLGRLIEDVLLKFVGVVLGFKELIIENIVKS